MAERTAEAIARRLAEIVDELAALPKGPSPERFRLLSERDSLRADASEFRMASDGLRSVESLEAELMALKRQRTNLVRTRGGYVTGDGADSAGRVGVSLTRLGEQSARAADIERMTARISEIEDALAHTRDVS